eukprot:COSAG02_NODE_19938_length_857_cov_0.951187_1_plen_167_part_10
MHAKQQPPAQQVQVQADEQSEGPVDLSAHPVTASLVVANDGRQLQCTRALLEHADQLRQVLIDLKLIVATMTVESTAASSATAASRCLLIAAVLSAVRFTGMMLFSESVGLASVAAAFHTVIFASMRVVLALAVALLLVVTNVVPYTPAITAADAAAGEAEKEKAEA